MALTPQRPIRLGILGGTFDPIHIAHLIIAEEARFFCHLDRVLFMPAYISPLKVQGGTLFTPEERYEMACLATADYPRFEVSRLELDREGPSYTVDTLRLLREAYGPETGLFFIMGMDSLLTLPHWVRPQEIVRLARLIVISRPGYQPDLEALERQVPGVRQATEMLLTLEIGISSTELRRRIRQGLPIRYQVPAAVEAFIHARYPLREPAV
ncbi:MAG: nicotinate (nicotinamide) nucleotide adenylyltransferase [Chloroflexi bacterium]|nr:nicotinate (nicotinamide) nucleotide adenylyltransferase [Chloroflexota bacterium]